MAALQVLSTIVNDIFLVSFVSVLLFYIWFKYTFGYWARRNVSGPSPSISLGYMRDVITRKKQFFQPYCDIYVQYKKLPYVGFYSLHTPVLCINDPDLAKLILVKDFDHFQSHGIFSNSSVGDPLGGHLFNIAGPKWKSIRTKLSPSFTSGKLKTFYPLVDKVAKEALEYSDTKYINGQSINFAEFYAKYAMEIIGSVGFGIENDGFNKETEFYKRGNEYFEPSTVYWTLIRAISYFFPDVITKLGVNRTNPEIHRFFFGLVKDTVSYREMNNFQRNDFIQTLMELHNAEKTGKAKDAPDSFSFIDVVSNTMLYMFAGYETSATSGCFAAYELACNPDVQAKAREEVKRVLAKYNGQCTFEAQNEMTYLNMVLDETLRKYPPLRALFRRCNKDYKLADSDLVIESGTLLFIPIHAIHMDPDIFEEPEKFDPERFTPEKKAKLHPCHWMPFGEGPRKCLGLRQGYIQAKAGLIKLLDKYEFILDERTITPIKLKTSSMVCAPEGGLWIKLKKLEN